MNLNYFCDFCKKDISKSNKSKHIGSKKHQNKVNGTEIKYTYHCDSCNAEILRSNKLRHEKTNKHLLKQKFEGGDIQTFSSKLPGFPWSKYPGEHHLPKHNYTGQWARVCFKKTC